MSALERRRFSRDSIRHYIRRADALCRRLDDQGIALVEANQKHIQAYVYHHARLPDSRYIHGRLCTADAATSSSFDEAPDHDRICFLLTRIFVRDTARARARYGWEY